MNDVIAQYRSVRENVGLIDRSKAGKLAIVGKDRVTWLQGMVSNDLRLLEQGTRRLPACILDATGHILTDLALIAVSGQRQSELLRSMDLTAEDLILIDLPRINLEKITTLLDRYLITEDVEIIDVSDRLRCVSWQGKRADRLLERPDAPTRLAVEADHTGSGGYDVYAPAETPGAADAAGKPTDLPRVSVDWIGVEAQELLRIEAGIPKYGADMDDTVLAPEANLMPTHISLTKGCYVGQEIVARIDSRGHTNRALTGLVFATGQIPVPGDRIYAPSEGEGAGREVGRITSAVAASPALEGRPIALGYVRHEHRTPGTRLRVGEASIEAEVRELPFYSAPQRTAHV